MRCRLTMSAVYMTVTGRTSTQVVSNVYTLDPGTTEDEMIEFLIGMLRARVVGTDHAIKGDVDVKRFEVEYL